MSDARARQRWEARRKMIADDFFAGDEANAEMVFDCLPYSAIPDWGDVEVLMQSMDAAGLLATPAHDAAVAARALREAAESMWRHKDPGHWNLRGEVDPDLAASPDVWIEWRADRIEREGETDHE